MQKQGRSRSFTGCQRCKRRHLKCDEAKPSCTRCASTGEQCSYNCELSWGGRGFDKSCFGVCLKGNKVTKIRTETGNLIYAAIEDGRNPYYRTDPTPWQLNAEYGEAFSNMRATHRYLLEFFLCETSRIISCHQDVRNNLCRAVIPMAMEEPCLLSAVLAVSGNYFISSGASSSHVDPTLIANLSNSSIAGLRSAFNKQAPVTAATLATAMFLCLYDIHSGIGATGSWRVHFQGARAIMSSLGHSSAVLYSKNQRTSWRILAQMYISIELIGSLTIKGLPMRQYSRLSLHANHIDEYFGVSTGLLDILREVGAAAAKRRRMDRDGGYLGMLPYDDLLQEADSLEQSVRSMMALKRTTPTPFHPRMEELLSPEEKHEYQLCNEAYQHTALINIHSCIRLLPGSTPKVQTSVQRILEIADQMKSTSGMSPWLLMATPLFTAGSYAFGPDRDRMRDLFTTFQRTIRIANYQRSLELLETYWKESDQGSAQDIEFVIDMQTTLYLGDLTSPGPSSLLSEPTGTAEKGTGHVVVTNHETICEAIHDAVERFYPSTLVHEIAALAAKDV